MGVRMLASTFPAYNVRMMCGLVRCGLMRCVVCVSCACRMCRYYMRVAPCAQSRAYVCELSTLRVLAVCSTWVSFAHSAWIMFHNVCVCSMCETCPALVMLNANLNLSSAPTIHF